MHLGTHQSLAILL